MGNHQQWGIFVHFPTSHPQTCNDDHMLIRQLIYTHRIPDDLKSRQQDEQFLSSIFAIRQCERVFRREK